MLINGNEVNDPALHGSAGSLYSELATSVLTDQAYHMPLGTLYTCKMVVCAQVALPIYSQQQVYHIVRDNMVKAAGKLLYDLH